MTRIRMILGVLFCAQLLVLALGVAPAQANRALLTKTAVETTYCIDCPPPTENEALKPVPPPEGQIEGACGVAVAPSGSLYVSDYYHHVVDLFASSGDYISQIPIVVPPGVPPAIPPEGPCGLAVDPNTGALYANYWHERVVRLTPTVQMFDSGNSTGVAVDDAGNVYVNNRTHVAVYEPSGAPLLHEGVPLRIGLGSLGDAYGLAVDPLGKKVYVPDAADNSIEVYEPAVNPFSPVSTIDGPGVLTPFVSLVDAAVAVDATNGNLLVVDNVQPGFEHPKSTVHEFGSSGKYLGQVAASSINGEPSGLAVDPGTGRLLVTSGNGEESNLYAYGPYTPSGPLAPSLPGEAPTSVPGGSANGVSGNPSHLPADGQVASASEITQRGGVRVSFNGELTPRALPRRGAAPVGIAIDTKIAATNGGDSPQLRRIAIEINRHGHFTPRGLSLCRLRDIQPSTTANALAACRNSLVGEGHFSADVKLPEQSPFPSEGKVLAFNGRLEGKPAILAHIYGTQPVPTSYVLPFLMGESKGTYGTRLEASLPQATGDWGYVTGLRMTLRRRFSYRGERRSYLSAGCPAPPGFPSVVFPLARTTFDFAGGTTLISILSRTCKATR